MKLVLVLLLIFAGVFILQQVSLRWAKPITAGQEDKLRIWIIVLVLLNLVLFGLSRFL